MRLSELYNSTQGEGPRVGLPTTFVRFGGCNLRCPSWPCDSPYAIFPKEYRNEWQTITAEELSDKIVELTVPGSNVCLTGGEPWLQSHEELKWLINYLEPSDRHIECFSNATIEIPSWVFEHTQIQFVFDHKLRGSGEKSLNTEIIERNIRRAVEGGQGVVKFTIADWDDFSEAVAKYERLEELIGETPTVYAGVVWGKVTEAQLAQWIQESDLYNWHLNVQVHKYIYGDIRGI